MTQTNPFLSAPFPGAGGEYRFDGKTLHDETPAAPASAEAATDEPAETETVADKTTQAGSRRQSR